VARALIVGCGRRGREIGGALLRDGWLVRGTTRRESGLAAIEAAGLEAALADPDRPGTVLDVAGDVAAVVWLLGSASGDEAALEAVHGTRLERLLEKLVDSPVRAFVYEACGSAPARCLDAGAAIVRAAGERWRIPVAVVDADPGAPEAWAAAIAAASAGSA
jgi:uncharacterized protein YbjT (DUF2867 family)